MFHKYYSVGDTLMLRMMNNACEFNISLTESVKKVLKIEFY